MATFELTWTSPDTCSILCTYCSKGKSFTRDTFRSLPNPLRIKCGCGHITQLDLDRRRFKRTLVDLTGTLRTVATHEPLGALTIIDLSSQGVEFVSPFPGLKVGETYTITFVLDDAERVVF